MWDSSEYQVAVRTGARSSGTCCCIAEDGHIITGWSDGFIRCFDGAAGALRWEIARCHKGAITTIFADENYIISGGEDGIVRIWGRSNRVMIIQLSDHRRSVMEAFPDLLQSHVIHSCGIDRTISTWDIKKEKRIITHQLANGCLLGMTQRKDSEQELVTIGSTGAALFWDIDEANPVASIPLPGSYNAI